MVLEKIAIQEAIETAFKEVTENIGSEFNDESIVNVYTEFFPKLKEAILSEIEQRSIFK